MRCNDRRSEGAAGSHGHTSQVLNTRFPQDIFFPLTPWSIRALNLNSTVQERKIEFEITNDAKDKLALDGYNPMYGARPLKRIIRQKIENPLSKAILKGEFTDGDKILIDDKDDEITFSKK